MFVRELRTGTRSGLMSQWSTLEASRRWLPVLLLIIVGTAGSLLYVQTRTPEYEARATVLVASQRISETLIASTVETNQLEKVSAILGELFARRTLAELIEEHGLYAAGEEGEVLTLEEKAAILRRQIVIAPDSTNQANQDPRSSATVFEVLNISKRALKRSQHTNITNTPTPSTR